MNTNLKFLQKFIEIKSVSTDAFFAESLIEARKLLENYLKELGFVTENLGKNKSVIYAKRNVKSKTKRLLIYGHYDVQPANESSWKSDPFKLTEQKNKLFARGISDDKGQLFIILEALKELISNNNLNNLNVSLLIEGEEEISSPTLQDILNKKIIKDKIDYIFIADSYMIAPNMPTIVSSFRGNIAFEITLQTLKQEVHSGIFGGAVENAAENLVNLHSKLFDQKFLKKLNKNNKLNKNKKLIEGCLKADELSFIKEIENNSVTKYYKDKPSYLSSLNPSLELTGIFSGYTDDGVKNIVPATAVAKYNYRFVAGQKGKELVNSIKEKFNHLNDKKLFKAEIKFHRISEPCIIDIDSKYVQNAIESAKGVYKNTPLLKSEGGSISVVTLMKSYLTGNILLFGFSDLDSNIHGPNENLRINNLEKGSRFIKNFFTKLNS